MYNGNIAETSWRTSSDNIRRKYEYAYDDLDRLLGAYFNIPGTTVQGSYDEYLSYDSNGNILTLQRYGEREDATLTMLIDDLNYGYDIGNKLLNVTDEEAHPSGFNDGNIHTQTNLPDFVYDAAGNLTRDRNKKISAITYNHLNQPKKLTSDTGEITYLYDASGNKVQKQVTENGQTQTTDYLGGFQYLAGKLDFLPHAEGYVKAVHTGSTTEYHYVYHYTDHLGNIRLSYGRDPETNEVAILKESHYYPFGLQHRGYVGDHRVFEQVLPIGRVNLIPVRNYLDDSYRYTFGGKEEQPELGLNWIDHHARNYMPDLGRWMNVDPLAEKYPSISPFAYVANNPLKYIDPDGMRIEPVYDTNGNHISNTEEGFTGQVLIYSGNEEIDFSTMSADDAMLVDGVDTYDSQRNALSGDAKSNIWTHIASDMEGKQIYDETFSMSTIDGGIKFRENMNASWGVPLSQAGTGKGRIYGSDKYIYETTVENIQSSVIVHEWYSHLQKGNQNALKSHRLAYKNVINYKSLWNNTTKAYKGFNVRALLKYTQDETQKLKVDLPYKRLYEKYHNEY